MLSHRTIAQRLPDLPRWVEVRDLLLSESGEITGLQEEPELSFVLRDPETASVFVVGAPAASTIQAAVLRAVHGTNVITPQEQAAWLAKAFPEWAFTRIIVHLLPDHQSLPPASAGEVSFLDPSTLHRFPIPAELLAELENGAEHFPIAATMVENQPVSFCYAGSVTESLWDVALDTLPQHRRKGYAALCAAHMIRHMYTRGKEPVWQAEEKNPASWRLAQKLGFTAVDELALIEPRAQASSLQS
jgi:GNAT superfamily N-acetyltransferase